MRRFDYLRANQSNRLADGGRVDRGEPMLFEFAGRRLMGYAGDTLASALLASGVDVVGRSFKYARPRGIMTAGVEEPNAIVQLGARPDTQVPNVRATEQPLFDGLVAAPVNGWPSADNDVMGLVGKLGGDLMTPGFYYKTFMWPRSRWETYERFIRKAAGLGRAPTLPDPDRYEHVNRHVDALVVGAGPTGLTAALAAARRGARVMLVDERGEPGGGLLAGGESIDGRAPMDWVAATVAELDAMPNVVRLADTTLTGLHDHHFATAWERAGDRFGERPRPGDPRHRLHRIRAGSVVLASGAHERPLVYANNDLPGCMTANAVAEYIERFAVVPGRRLVVGCANDGAYRAALAWHRAGREVVAVVDSRKHPEASVIDEAIGEGIAVITGSVVMEALGSRRVRGALVAPVDARARFVTGNARMLECDTIATSGGWSPAVHLACHTGGRPVWSDAALGFVPPAPGPEPRFDGGSVLGRHRLAECLGDGLAAGRDAAAATLDGAANEPAADGVDERVPATGGANATSADPMPLFVAPHAKPPSRAPKQFVDFQNDVTAAGIEQTVREGFESIEHVKRYTALGFGTDQGKTSNVNGIAIVARALDRTIGETGTTVFRPNYTPVTMGAVAGAHVKELFDPQRFTPLHAWHVERGAAFENVGQWKRPRYYPEGDEDMHAAIAREQRAVRTACGVLDASTLGKIDVHGPDAREFLGRVYTNAWAKLAPGSCRYGLMCGEDGMLMDDGVTACLSDERFHMTTTTGGAASVLSWLESWLQTEWTDLDVRLTSVTDHWATLSIAGPNARALLSDVGTDIDLSPDAFGFMQHRTGTVAGVPARVFRISFTGELSFEINVAAHFAMHVWRALFEHGPKHGLVPYGTETMHVLRAEKGFVIVGQDSDGSVTPTDLGMDWAVGWNKPYSFLGRRGMRRADAVRAGRKRLVGLLAEDPDTVLPEGAQAVRDPKQPIPMTMVGHVTSSYRSEALGRSIALAVIVDGPDRLGETLHFPLADGRTVAARSVTPVFVDPDGARQRS